jgi:hypothetical protein
MERKQVNGKRLAGHTHLGERSTLSCPPVKNFPTLRFHLERPSGSPDHHRGLHKHHIRGCGPLLLILSLISYPKLVPSILPGFLSLFLGISILIGKCHTGNYNEHES